MKMHNLKICLIILLSFFTHIQYAQEAVLSSGGDVSGSGGTVSYSVGQVLFTADNGASSTVSKGVQQSYDIEAITGIDQANGISWRTQVYPNPVTDCLTLSISDLAAQSLQYQLYRFDGLLIEAGKITTSETEIKVHDFIQGAYILRISDDNSVIKAFKIIKR